MEKTVFKGAISKRWIFFIILLPLIIFFVLVTIFLLIQVPSLLKILAITIISIASLIFIFNMILLINEFNMEIRPNGSILIKRREGLFFNKFEDNTINMTAGGVFCSISKNNISKIENISNEDSKLINKYSFENVFTFNPIRKIGYTIDVAKSMINKGINSLYSFIFVSNKNKVVKITLKKIKIKTHFQEKIIDSPILFISLKEPGKFLQSFKK